MSNTSRLNLPFLAAGQSQKHVTLNEALSMLDTVVQLSVLSRQIQSVPTTPLEGDRYIVPPSSTGIWSAHSGKIASYEDGDWQFFAPQVGWLAWIVDENSLKVFDGSNWRQAIGSSLSIGMLGVNATANTSNRLALSSDAALFNHSGNSHRLAINKANPAATASVVFQEGFSGKAEIGLCGNNQFSIKYSAGGPNWTEVLRTESESRTWFGGHYFDNVPAWSYASIGVGAAIAGERAAAIDFLSTTQLPGYSTRLIRDPGPNGTFSLLNAGSGNLRLGAEGAGSVHFTIGSIDRLRINTSGHFVPMLDNATSLGSAGQRFSAIWAANGVIQTSDARDKDVIAAIAPGSACSIVDQVKPVFFRWKCGGQEIQEISREDVPLLDGVDGLKMPRVNSITLSRAGERCQAGFLAQDIKGAMDVADLDFGAWGLEDQEDPNSRQWLRPDQLIPVLWAALKETRAELMAVSADLRDIKRAGAGGSKA